MKMRFSLGQRETLVRFLTNAGTIALGGLILGPSIGHQPFQLRMFVVGWILYATVLGLVLWLSPSRKEEK